MAAGIGFVISLNYKANELPFQNDMIAHLLANGWLLGKPENYNRELALYPEDLLGFVQETQDAQWQKFCALYPNNSEEKFLERTKKTADAVLMANAENSFKECKKEKDALEIFKKDLGTFVRFYEFMSQIVDYGDKALEKLNLYARNLPHLSADHYEGKLAKWLMTPPVPRQVKLAK